jgi:AraC family transcriptional regulator of adaptative response/methylated-DNA-[protein]-cysteine methyltransferase
VVAGTDRGICGLHFLAGRDPNAMLKRERRRFESAEWREAPGRTSGWVDRVFEAWDRAGMHRGAAVADPPRAERPNGASGIFAEDPLPLLLTGTNFQIQVWQALLRIPPGSAVPYKRVAEYLDRPRAARAVANAVGANPIGYLIPCHRVIRSTGAFGGYQSGTERKRAMLAREGARTVSRSS